MENQKKPPSRLFYLFAVIIFIVGVTAFVLLLINSIKGMTNGIQQIVVPASSEIELSDKGKYIVYYEYHSMVDGKIYSTGEDDFNELKIKLKNIKTNENIKIENYTFNSSYDINERSGVAVLEFNITQPGKYEFSAQYDNGKEGQDVVVAIGKDNVAKLVFGILACVFILLLTNALAIGMIVFTAIKRKKALDLNKEVNNSNNN